MRLPWYSERGKAKSIEPSLNGSTSSKVTLGMSLENQLDGLLAIKDGSGISSKDIEFELNDSTEFPEVNLFESWGVLPREVYTLLPHP